METTGNGQEGDIVEQVMIKNRPLTYFERFLLNSSEPLPDGQMYTMDRVIEENFPDLINKVPPMEGRSLEEINEARRQENPILTDSVGPLSFTLLPEDGAYQIYLSDLEPDITRAEFGVVETFIGGDGTFRKKEVTDPEVIARITPDKLGDDFKLEPVPDNDSRRYIVPVRKP